MKKTINNAESFISNYVIQSFPETKFNNQTNTKRRKKGLIYFIKVTNHFNRLSGNPTKWSDTFKQCVGCCQGIVLVRLTILWGWRLKG